MNDPRPLMRKRSQRQVDWRPVDWVAVAIWLLAVTLGGVMIAGFVSLLLREWGNALMFGGALLVGMAVFAGVILIAAMFGGVKDNQRPHPSPMTFTDVQLDQMITEAEQELDLKTDLQTLLDTLNGDDLTPSPGL